MASQKWVLNSKIRRFVRTWSISERGTPYGNLHVLSYRLPFTVCRSSVTKVDGYLFRLLKENITKASLLYNHIS